ncbi:hypothetical protein E2562_007112 [Oryza meyeriana var. granulata]|uniref:Uncharacterized protein n=1 Tax=Oryza meyeriana var. granulata TaxID=110450 RepID=A0A6G1F520_9ORYZ|nr:hypothetical protein E2562_007112 [Oryza meyeriana var. granulata]
MAAVDDPVANPEWSLRCRVDLDSLATAGDLLFANFVPDADGVDKATLLAMFYKEWCGHRKPVVKVVGVQGSRYSCDPTPTLRHVLRYVESLVSISAHLQLVKEAITFTIIDGLDKR